MGWTGQTFFFLRFLVQWTASEKAGRIVVPAVFWWLSLIGAIFTGIYAGYERNLIFLASPVINLFIYGRNIALNRTGKGLTEDVLIPMAGGLGILIVIAFIAKIEPEQAPFWLVLGTFGQLCWISRFPIQWWISERQEHSDLQPLFFWISFIGSLFLLAYAFHTGKLIFIVGMIIGPFLYGRNLILAHRDTASSEVT